MATIGTVDDVDPGDLNAHVIVSEIGVVPRVHLRYFDEAPAEIACSIPNRPRLQEALRGPARGGYRRAEPRSVAARRSDVEKTDITSRRSSWKTMSQDTCQRARPRSLQIQYGNGQNDSQSEGVYKWPVCLD
jgi:hypothetical protein